MGDLWILGPNFSRSNAHPFSFSGLIGLAVFYKESFKYSVRVFRPFLDPPLPLHYLKSEFAEPLSYPTLKNWILEQPLDKMKFLPNFSSLGNSSKRIHWFLWRKNFGPFFTNFVTQVSKKAKWDCPPLPHNHQKEHLACPLYPISGLRNTWMTPNSRLCKPKDLHSTSFWV